MKKQEKKEKLLELIKEGKTYKESAESMEKDGEKLAGSVYYAAKQTVFPSDKMDAALEQSGERRQDREERKVKEKRRVAWTTKKQQDADNSNLAKLINKGVFHGTFPFCRNKALREEDVQDINLGGAVVANITYFFPDIDLNHPLIVLTTRILMFYIKFKSICSAITEKMDELKAKVIGAKSGIKEEWQQK